MNILIDKNYESRNNYYNCLLRDLKSNIPAVILDSLLKDYVCEYDNEFLGFLDVYAPLEHIIPLDVTVIDLGCAAAFQAHYFRNHAAYIGIDASGSTRYLTPNSRHYVTSIQNYLKHVTINDQSKVFAVCSYVPCHDDVYEMIKEKFNNCRIYYPGSIDILRMDFSKKGELI